MQLTEQEGIKLIAELVKDIKVAMLTTVCPEGELHSRPMVVQKTDFDGTLWFFTNDESAKTKDLVHERQVNVALAKPDGYCFASLAGLAIVVYDKEKMNALWNPAYKAWFPKGLEDPHLALIRVEIESAQYWKSPSSPVVYLMGLAKALLTRQPASAADVGQRSVLEFHRKSG